MDISTILMEHLSTVVWAVTVIVVVILARKLLYPLMHQIMHRIEAGTAIEIRLDDLRERIADIEIPPRVQEALARKRERMLKLPNLSFHYADKDRITNFYNDYFKEPYIENVVSKMATEISGDVAGKLPKILEAKAGVKDLTEWISTMKLPETSLNGMLLRYQRETIRNDQVRLDVELLDVEFSELQTFEKLVEELNKNIEMKIADETLESHSVTLKQKMAETTLSKLEGVSGWVIVEGAFVIAEVGDEFYSLSCRHPISEFLEEAGKDVLLTVLVPKTSVEPHVAGSYAQSIGKAIPLHVYGEIWQPLDREDDGWKVQITPLAVY